METEHLRLRPWLAGAALLAVCLLPQQAHAASIRTYLDGRDLAFPVSPVVEEGRTLVPARRLLESLGATVEWDEPTRTVSAIRDNMVVRAVIGSPKARVNGLTVDLEVPPRILDGYTLIPLRFFVENLGLSVAWEEATSTIHIDSTRNSTVSRDGTAAPSLAPRVLELARQQVGLGYAWGGTSPTTGFDCSGLMYYLGSQVGVELPRTSYEMAGTGMQVTRDQLQAGDLVFFTTYAEGPSHVGIYDGEGSFIHAQSSETGVRVTAMSNPWWAQRYVGARRIFN